MKPSDTLRLTKVVRASEKDFEKVYGILSRCAAKLKERGLNDWTNYYTQERVSEKVKEGLMYLVSFKEKVVGCFTLNKRPIYYYTEVDRSKFKDQAAKAWYLSTLGIDPIVQGRGFGSTILRYVEDEAIKSGIGYIRLDCNATDSLLMSFYDKNGYARVSPMDGEPEYMLREKEL